MSKGTQMARYEKYGALRKLLETKAIKLKQEGLTSFEMTFAEIEAVLGFPLPPSAYQYPEWWTNNNKYYRSNSLNDRSNKVWERAGFWTKNVDVELRTVSFKYKGPLSPEDKVQQQERSAENNRKLRQVLADSRERRPAFGMSDASQPFSKNQIHPAFGTMKGLLRVVAGTDLTKPADPDWGKRDR